MTWQPIDTAPKDGTLVMLIDGTAGRPTAMTAYWAKHDAWGAEPAWLCANGDAWPPAYSMSGRERNAYAMTLGTVPTPTHWMPLPEPPQ